MPKNALNLSIRVAKLSIADKKLRERLRVLFALVKCSRRSDRELSKVLKSPVSAVSRRRRELEEANVILNYTVVPDFRKLGFGVQAFTFVSVVGCVRLGQFECLRNLSSVGSCVLFASVGEGLGADCVVVSLHESYDVYLEFVSCLRLQLELRRQCLVKIQCFVMSTDKSQVVLPFSLQGLEESTFGFNGGVVGSNLAVPLLASKPK